MFIRALAATVVSAGLVVPLTAVAAQADTSTCVTKAEFKAVRKGWSITKVRNRFDIGGKQTYFFSGTQYSNASQGREYNGCPEYSYVSVDFEKKKGVWRVTGKYAYWG